MVDFVVDIVITMMVIPTTLSGKKEYQDRAGKVMDKIRRKHYECNEPS